MQTLTCVCVCVCVCACACACARFLQGIGTAAHIHIALAAPALPHASDCCGCIYWEEDFITTPLRIEGGYAYPPQVRLPQCCCSGVDSGGLTLCTLAGVLGTQGAVGLGVELDMAAVERWSRPGPPNESRPRPPPTPQPARAVTARM